MDVTGLLQSFAQSPDAYSVTRRQADKLINRLTKVNANPAVALQMVQEIGQKRAALAGPTLYISSMA